MKASPPVAGYRTCGPGLAVHLGERGRSGQVAGWCTESQRNTVAKASKMTYCLPCRVSVAGHTQQIHMCGSFPFSAPWRSPGPRFGNHGSTSRLVQSLVGPKGPLDHTPSGSPKVATPRSRSSGDEAENHWFVEEARLPVWSMPGSR